MIILIILLIIILCIFISICFKKSNFEDILNKKKLNYKIKLNIHPEIYNKGYKNCIVTLYTPNIENYAKYSIKNIKYYCLKHNLTLYIFNEEFSENVEHKCWNKIPAILYLMHNTGHQYIIWIDIDAVFNRLDIKFDKFIDKYKDKNIIYCRDIHDRKYKFNSGVMIIKNNQWSKKIFEDTWLKDVKHGYGGDGDQVILKQIILQDGKENNNYDTNSGNIKTVLLEERQFNSYPRNNITDNDFIIHFMGFPGEKRIESIIKINNKLGIS